MPSFLCKQASFSLIPSDSVGDSSLQLRLQFQAPFAFLRLHQFRIQESSYFRLAMEREGTKANQGSGEILRSRLLSRLR